MRALISFVRKPLAGWVLACAALQASATPSEVAQLIDAGQLDQAASRIEAGLQAQPGNPQWRFLQGVWLSALQRNAEAMAAFESLINEFPELPEPYNNLAVLQAAQGRLADARRSLEAALRADPNYAVAHRNLGDVHVRLAIEAYERAGALQPDNGALRQRLVLLRDWLVSSRPSPRTTVP